MAELLSWIPFVSTCNWTTNMICFVSYWSPPFFWLVFYLTKCGRTSFPWQVVHWSCLSVYFHSDETFSLWKRSVRYYDTGDVGMWSNFSPSFFFFFFIKTTSLTTASVGTIIITTNTHVIHTLASASTAENDFCYTNSCEWVNCLSRLSFVFEPGLCLSAVTSHPSLIPA